MLNEWMNEWVQVAGEELKKDLADKTELLGEAARAIQALEEKHKQQVEYVFRILVLYVQQGFSSIFMVWVAIQKWIRLIGHTVHVILLIAILYFSIDN